MEHKCETCRSYKDHPGGIFGGDGLCHFDYKRPKPVRKWFKNCKYWREEKEKKDGP